MAEQDFIIRETQPEDGAALNALYLRLTGVARTIEQWRWEWFDAPQGPCPSWVIVDAANGRIVGHHGVVPVPLVHGGKRITAARTENTMIDPDVRRRLIYPPIEARLLTTLLQRFDLIFTTSGKGSHGMVRKRLGYRSAGHWQTFTVGMTPAYVVQRFAGAPLARLAAPLSVMANRPPQNWRVEETSDVARIAATCATWHDAHAVAPERSADYLGWRLSRHPYHRFRLALLHHRDRPAAFLAWRESEGVNGTKDIHIEDICTAESDTGFDAAFRTLIALHRSQPARVTLRILDNDRPLARAAHAHALRTPTAAEGAELLVRWRDERMEAAWDATMVLAEGI